MPSTKRKETPGEKIKRAVLSAAPEAYLVGGAVRDALLGRPVLDLDLCTCSADPDKTAASAAKAAGGVAILLDEETRTWRVAVKTPFTFQLDISPYQGKNRAADISRRDFTVNSLAVPLAEATVLVGKTSLELAFPKTSLINSEALRDLKARKVRMNSASVFKADPLRLLRAFRTAAELDFDIDKKTLAAIKANARLAPRPSGERIREELRRILSAPGAGERLVQMDKTGVLCAVFPELKAQRKCALNYYGKGGVLKHTLAVVSKLEYFLDHIPAIYPEFHKGLEPLAAQRSTMLLAALLHDIAKPSTAKMREGRLRFFLHEEEGAIQAEEVLSRLKSSRAETRLITHIIREHLRPGNLSANGEISDRAVYRFFRDMGPDAMPLLALCWADYASFVTPATLASLMKKAHCKPPVKIDFQFSKNSPAKTLRHLQVIYQLMQAGLLRRDTVEPPKLVTGADVMKAAAIEPGPRVGEILEELRARQAEGKIRDREQAMRWLSSLKGKSK